MSYSKTSKNFRSWKQEPNSKEPSKIFLNIKYSEKDDAKKLKARWCPEQKSWYTLSNNVNNASLFENYTKRDSNPTNEVPEVPEVSEKKNETIYIPEGCVMHNGRIRKQRFFSYDGNEV